MKTESTRPENSKTEASKPEAKARPGSAALTERSVVRMDLAVGDLVPDPENRAIDETDEDFATLTDSVRVMGVLVALQAQRRADGKFQIWDGERRWRAARRAGLPTVPCDVCPENTNPRDLLLAGVVINEQRRAHSCLAVARRLRAVKNQYAESHEQVAARTGLPLKRVTGYLNLFNASDRLLAFYEEEDIPLKTAVELMRYEKALGEVAARRLIERQADEPLTARGVELLRKRGELRQREEDTSADTPKVQTRIGKLAARLETEIRKDPSSARRLLEEAAAMLGLRLVQAAPVSAPGA